MRKAFVSVLFLLAGVFLLSAQNLPSIRITNNTGYDVYYIYISPSDSEDWGEEFLGDDVLLDGHSVNIRLDYPLSRAAVYDIRVEDEDGDTYVKRGEKLANNARIVFTEADLDF